jgi:hypothetical protein
MRVAMPTGIAVIKCVFLFGSLFFLHRNQKEK